MRTVIDTNVLVSAFLWRGTPRALLAQIQAGRLALVTSQGLIDELAVTLVRAKFQAALARSDISVAWIMAKIQSLADIVEAPPLPSPVCRDPDDDAVLAAAIAAQADLIISGDADLIVLCSYAGIPIMPPAQALAMIDPALP